MKKIYFKPQTKVALDVLTSEELLMVTSPTNTLPSEDDPLNQFSKERDDDDDEYDEDLW